MIIGIDIGGTNTKFGLVGKDGEIAFRGSMQTTGYAQPKEYTEALVHHIQPLFEKAGGKENIKGIGIGAPNGNMYSGCIEYAANLGWEGIIPIASWINESTGLPVSLTNDANAAAMGEMHYGQGKGMQDFIVITLGTGVGSGIVANGKLIAGHNGFAGELGHTIIRPGGRLHPGTHLVGSLEMYAGAAGIVMTAIELAQSNTLPTQLNYINPKELTVKQLFEYAKKDDPVAIRTFELTGEILGEAFSNFVHTLAPEAIILFGGVTHAGELLRQPIIRSMEKHLLKVFQNQVKILYSTLPESDAAIVGAAGLILSV
ncbi:MAG: ROK family protein [Ferruginibacter sp.]|nr:ROK family protein [Ferruginibacter sp.]